MDTITQIVLGGAVGEATLGKKVGNKAVLWGAIGGTIPDLDVIPAAMMNPVARIEFHRGFSHSIFFAMIMAPILGWLIYKLYKEKQASWRDWSWLFFWAIFTHPILDNFTSYGTAFLLPFSNARIAWNTIFVVDPLYTIPFLICLIIILFLPKISRNRRMINYIGISLSSLYLLFTVGNKFYVNSIFEAEFQRQQLSVKEYMTNPTPLNNLLWRFVGKTENGYFEGYYSLLDESKEIQFNYISRNDSLVTGLTEDPQLTKLIWLTKGYYNYSNSNGELFINDMRFGRLDAWNGNKMDPIFRFKLLPEKLAQGGDGIIRVRPRANLNSEIINTFIDRVMGK